MADVMENPFNNPEFRREMSEMLDEKLGPLTLKVDTHEAQLQQAKGARWAFAGLWGGLLGTLTVLVEWLAHRR